MEEVPDRVADGVDHPEPTILEDAVVVSLRGRLHADGASFRERLHADGAVVVRDVSRRHRMGVALAEREELAALPPFFMRVFPLRLCGVVEIPIARLVGAVLEEALSWVKKPAWKGALKCKLSPAADVLSALGQQGHGPVRELVPQDAPVLWSIAEHALHYRVIAVSVLQSYLQGILGERENVLLHKAGPVQARVEARQEPTPVPTLRGESFSDERDERSGVDACLSEGRFFFKSENFGLRAHNEVI